MNTEIEKLANQILEPVNEAIIIDKIAEEILGPMEKVANTSSEKNTSEREDVIIKIAEEIIASALEK